jgi:tRNA nucleotidyltransferase/poly(A) polymerase
MKKHLQHPVFKKLSELADATGTEIYVIGGYVRDIFLKRPSKDIDIVSSEMGLNSPKQPENYWKAKFQFSRILAQRCSVTEIWKSNL